MIRQPRTHSLIKQIVNARNGIDLLSVDAEHTAIEIALHVFLAPVVMNAYIDALDECPQAFDTVGMDAITLIFALGV